MRYGEAWDVQSGEPHAAVLAEGTKDVAQLIGELYAVETPLLSEAITAIVREANRSVGGRAALALLRDEGGPDLLVDVTEFAVEKPGILTTAHSSLTAALFTKQMLGGQLVWRHNMGPWTPVSENKATAHVAKHGRS